MPDDDRDRSDDLVIVGVGASAGGLEALQSLFSRVEKNGTLAFVVAQHLSATHKSMMVNLLAKASVIDVVAATNGMKIEADRIFVCPPNRHILVEDGKIFLKDLEPGVHSPRPSIDLLFESLAVHAQSNAVGIILSGTGTDGARGIRAVKARGGFTFVQEPASAKYNGMPNAALQTASVDFVLTPDLMIPELMELVSRSETPQSSEADTSDAGLHANILEKLKKIFGVDFSLYKTNTIARRIERRMVALKLDSLQDYSNHLSKDAAEPGLLFNNILIGVTSFFRDEEVFDRIRSEVSRRLEEKGQRLFRAWVPGCSTGEEAFSLAMIVREALGDDIRNWKIQIFASDIDERALDIARMGRYPESAVSQLPKHLRNKYFSVEGDQYTAAKSLREMIIFSRHDVTADPPFLRLDLVSCRNLLIYFGAELQKRVLPSFHYALGEKGLLILGKSETIGQFDRYFRTIDATWRLFEANYLGPKEAPDGSFFVRGLRMSGVSEAHPKPASLRELLHDAVQRHLQPLSVLVNRAHNIVYNSGNNPYLSRPVGETSDNVFRNVHPALSTELRSAIVRSTRDQEVVKTRFFKLNRDNEGDVYVRMVVAPFGTSPDKDSVSLVCFQEESIDSGLFDSSLSEGDGVDDAVIGRMEFELARAREQSQTLVEELETSNEELQSMNEELQSSNEELQSSNEELETTNEELQSTNEELQTAYHELRAAYRDSEQQSRQLEAATEELGSLNSQLETAQQIANIGHFKWDLATDQIVWSKSIYRILGNESSESGPTILGLLARLHPDDRPGLEKLLEQSRASADFNTRFRLRMEDGSIRHIRAVGEVQANAEGEPECLNGILQDVTEITEAREDAEKSDVKLTHVMDNALMGVYVFDIKRGKNTYINDRYTALTGYTLADIEGMSQEDFMGLFHDDEREKVQQRMGEVIAAPVGEVSQLRYRFRHKNGSWLWLLSCDTIMEKDEDGNASQFLGTFVDISGDAGLADRT